METNATAAIPSVTAVSRDGRLYSTAWSALLAHGDPDGDGEVWLFRSGISGAFFTVTREGDRWVIDPCSSFAAYKTYDDLPEHDAPYSALRYAGTFA